MKSFIERCHGYIIKSIHFTETLSWLERLRMGLNGFGYIIKVGEWVSSCLIRCWIYRILILHYVIIKLTTSVPAEPTSMQPFFFPQIDKNEHGE